MSAYNEDLTDNNISSMVVSNMVWLVVRKLEIWSVCSPSSSFISTGSAHLRSQVCFGLHWVSGRKIGGARGKGESRWDCIIVI